MFCNSWKHTFVYESNLIDPQPGFVGNHSGCTLYNNHMNALNFALSSGWEITKHTPLDLHRFLTKNIPFFENGNSGQYRTVDVWIGHDLCPSPVVIPSLMDNWFDFTKKIMDSANDNKISALDAALLSHHFFEVVHPFIDGNGRTGRLLIQKILTDLGADPIIIRFDDRAEYYEAIDSFRDQYWTGTGVDYGLVLLDHR